MNHFLVTVEVTGEEAEKCKRLIQLQDMVREKMLVAHGELMKALEAEYFGEIL